MRLIDLFCLHPLKSQMKPFRDKWQWTRLKLSSNRAKQWEQNWKKVKLELLDKIEKRLKLGHWKVVKKLNKNWRVWQAMKKINTKNCDAMLALKKNKVLSPILMYCHFSRIYVATLVRVKYRDDPYNSGFFWTPCRD